jgi:hypothetical protein
MFRLYDKTRGLWFVSKHLNILAVLPWSISEVLEDLGISSVRNLDHHHLKINSPNNFSSSTSANLTAKMSTRPVLRRSENNIISHEANTELNSMSSRSELAASSLHRQGRRLIGVERLRYLSTRNTTNTSDGIQEFGESRKACRSDRAQQRLSMRLNEKEMRRNRSFGDANAASSISITEKAFYNRRSRRYTFRPKESEEEVNNWNMIRDALHSMV